MNLFINTWLVETLLASFGFSHSDSQTALAMRKLGFCYIFFFNKLFYTKCSELITDDNNLVYIFFYLQSVNHKCLFAFDKFYSYRSNQFKFTVYFMVQWNVHTFFTNYIFFILTNYTNYHIHFFSIFFSNNDIFIIYLYYL